MDFNKRNVICNDDNIDELRKNHPNGLHFVVGDTHGEAETFKALMAKIKFDPKLDHVFLVGDYNEGGNTFYLMSELSRHYAADLSEPGFHLIRGNHEREPSLFPLFPLKNLPDIMVLRGKVLNFYLAHAGMVSKAFDLINDDMAKNPDTPFFAYKLDQCCTDRDPSLSQIVWSKNGLYSQTSRYRNWPSFSALTRNRACIIHGHSPYCYFKKEDAYTYGDNNLFFVNQHIWFSEDLQSFNIDSNVKGRYVNGESYRGLACVCLEVLEEIAAQNGGMLTAKGVRASQNFVFSSPHIWNLPASSDRDVTKIIEARPNIKTITLDTDGTPILLP